MHRITPFLWYDGHVQDAVTLYTSVVPAMLAMAKIDIAALERAAAAG